MILTGLFNIICIVPPLSCDILYPTNAGQEGNPALKGFLCKYMTQGKKQLAAERRIQGNSATASTYITEL